MNPAFSKYLQLTKPRLSLMVLVTALSGFYLASTKPLNFITMIHVLIGTWLVGSGANAVNQCMEQESDAKMVRTKNRPLPKKDIPQKKAFSFALTLSTLGVAHLFFFTNPVTAALGLLSLLSYTLLYTPLKKITWLNTFVGAIPGAIPTLMGWSAATGRFPDAKAWVIFAILFLWQMPHFFAIAWVYREDYKSGGFQMSSTADPTGRLTSFQIGIFGVLLFIASLLPTFFGIVGLLYFSAAFFTGLLFLTFALYAASHKISYAKQLVKASIFYLATLNIFLWFDKI